jgi:hypothetical protein
MRTTIKTFLALSAILSCKKYLLLFSVLMLSVVCFALPDTGIHFPKDSNRSKILIINSYDAQSMKARKNKKELFAQLVAALQKELAAEIGSKTRYEAVIIEERLLKGENHDSSLLSIIKENHPIKTIVIKAFDVWFEQTGVEVTEEEGGKKRSASYDICSNVMYQLYYGNIMQQEMETTYREHFTERSVESGFLSVGPDIVGKRKHAILLMNKNAGAFMRSAASWLSAP